MRRGKRISKRIIMDLLLLFCFLTGVFLASSQPYEKQDLRGTIRKYINMDQVQAKFGGVSFTYGKKEISVKKSGPDGFIEFFIRKGTHFLTFAMLGVLFCRIFRYWFQTREALGWSGFIVTLVAISDEWHQSFTPDRTSMITDVVLDVTGLIFAMTFITVIRAFKR